VGGELFVLCFDFVVLLKLVPFAAPNASDLQKLTKQGWYTWLFYL